MAFAVHMALGVWWPFALLIGLGWGFVVVNLDRMLLVGMAHDSSLKRNLVLAVPRVGLALILGVVIATPLTMQVFGKEIDTEIVTMQAEAGTPTGPRWPTTRGSRTCRSWNRGSLVPRRSSPAGGGRRRPRGARRGDGPPGRPRPWRRRALEAKAQCELDGTCGTGEAGTGTAYVEARAAADAQAAVVASARSALDDAVDAASAAEGRSVAGRLSLETDRAELTRLTAAQDRLQASFDATNEGAGGLLMRLEALDRLGDRNGTLAAAQFMLSLLFMSVELLPVLMKMLLNFSPPTGYDRLAALRDTGDVEIEELAQESRKTVAGEGRAAGDGREGAGRPAGRRSSRAGGRRS